jgi:hypothetical protein
VPDARPFIDKPRPFPNYPGITYLTNGAGHQYNGLTTEVERRFAQGLNLQGSWVWARDIGDANYGETIENPFDRERDRGVWLDVPTHRTTLNFIYQLPFGRGRAMLGNAPRWADLIAGGWEIAGIHSYYSGMFLTPLWTGPDPTGTAFTTSRTPPNVTIRPDHIRDANLPSDQRAVNRWFDPTAFAAPQQGRFGTSARGTIKGPDVNVWHAGVYKHFVITERVRFRWEITGTNILNRPNYSNPNVDISSVAGVGVISGVGGVNGASTGDVPGARALRMGLRLEW